MPDVQVPVFECFFNGDTSRWVKGQHLIQEIQRIRIGVGEETLEGHFRHVG